MSPSRITILGGGLAGLSSAFHLSRRFPSSAITLLEQSPRLGGWVNSERVGVQDSHGNRAKILLERGPRTLRPVGKSVLELINLLNLSSALLTVPTTAPAARTRFLHIPGTQGLTALPSGLGALFTSALGQKILCAGVLEPFRTYASLHSTQDADEALEPFLAARLGPELARILGSALVHGIYAADSRVLSVRAAFPSIWALADVGGGSIVRGMVARSISRATKETEKGNDYELGDVETLMKGVSVYSFRDGMDTLIRALEKELRDNPRVHILNEGAARIGKLSTGAVLVHTTSGQEVHASHLVSSISLPRLHTLLEASNTPKLPHLTANPSSSVAVVNLVFAPDPSGQRIHPDGFGYLIPRAENGDVEVLGTVFDSCALGGQDEYPSGQSPRFTKMTMMIRLSDSTPPVTEERVLAHLSSHLGKPVPRPVLFRVHPSYGCIPVPSVGHLQRMKELKNVLKQEWDDRFAIVGAGVGGVSVPDCVEQGRQVGKGW